MASGRQPRNGGGRYGHRILRGRLGEKENILMSGIPVSVEELNLRYAYCSGIAPEQITLCAENRLRDWSVGEWRRVSGII